MRKCDVCNKESNDIKVAGSCCGPISFAYCPECLKVGAEPYGALVSYIAFTDATENNWHTKLNKDYIQGVIEPTLRIANKNHYEFSMDLKKERKRQDAMYEEMYGNSANCESTEMEF